MNLNNLYSNIPNNEYKNLEKEREEVEQMRLRSLMISVPLMLYAGMGKKPPKVVKALLIGYAVYTGLKNIDALTKKD